MTHWLLSRTGGRARAAVSLLLPVLLVAPSTGCSDSDGLSIARFLAVDPSTSCIADSSVEIGRTRGVLDVGLATGIGRGYIAVPVVQNNFVDHSGNFTANVDAIIVNGVDVELIVPEALAGAIAPSQRKFYVPSSGGLVPATAPGAEAPSTTAIFADVLPAQLAGNLASVIDPGPGPYPTIIARVRPVGSHSGDRIAGQAAEFPIEVCEYCAAPAPQPCPIGGYPLDQVRVGGCFPQQDAEVTCCMSGTTLLCGRDVPTQ